jgi:predicted DNA-binding protein
MSPRPKAKHPKDTVIALRVSAEMNAQLQGVQKRDGMPISEQIRRAIRKWLEEEKGIKAERKRASTRKRS